MRQIFFSLILLGLSVHPFAVMAQERLNWETLEITTIEEDDEGDIVSSDTEESDGKFKSLFSSLHESIEKKRKEKSRKVEAVNKETVYSAIQEMIETSFPGGLEGMQKSNEKLEDDIYRLILMLPEYAYQYVGPFLHDMPHVPDRILNIPGIKETKGKFPTRIAPQMKEYAEKYGKYMSTYLYIYLMPEAWATPEKEESTFAGFNKIITIDENSKPDEMFIMLENTSLLEKHPMLSPEDYRTGKALERRFKAQTPAEQVTHDSPLTEGDVEAALASFDNIKKDFGEDRFDDFHKALRDMSLMDNNLMGELVNPMQTLTDKIKRLPEREKFEKTLAKNGFTLDGWGITVDKIIKARRVAKMSPGVAVNLAVWRRTKITDPIFQTLSLEDRQVTWDSIQAFIGLYTTTRENMLAIKNYGDKIRENFATKDMMFIEAPVFSVY